MEDDVDINTLTMEQYLAWVQDDIRPGVVKPKIGNDVEFEINSNFIRELRRKLFKGIDDEDAHEHMQRVLEIADHFHFPSVTHDVVMLKVFPITLKGPALRWINRLSAGLVTTWDLFEKAFLRQYCPPFKTAKKLEIIQNFKQEMDETLYYPWERISDSSDNVDAIQASFKGAHLTKECSLKKRTRKLSRAIKARTTMVKENAKEPIPHDLPVVHTYVPPTQFLDSPYRTHETICEIGIPEEIQEDKGDMNDGCDITVEDVERLRKILTPFIHTLPNLEPIVQPYMPLRLVCNKAKVKRKEEHDYEIPLQDQDATFDPSDSSHQTAR
ncbi:RNA-directed DNA polymerase, eukaryota, nucleotide-binding alpha-beta plait domain protein [Tanacetum coccineum]